MEGTPDDRRAEMVRAMKKATRALGGDLLVVTRFEASIGRSRASGLPDAYGTGYAFRTTE